MVLNLVYLNIKFGMVKTKVEYCVSFHFLVFVNQQKIEGGGADGEGANHHTHLSDAERI